MKDADDQVLPALMVGQQAGLSGVKVEEKKSSAPPRFGEGAFVQLMEKAGIGRPSTYASTLKTLQTRSYVTVRLRKLHVTPLGLCVAMYLMQQLPQLVDARFTAEMEQDLDTVAQGELQRTVYLDRVWRGALQPAIARAQRTAPRLRVPGQEAVFEVQGGQVQLRTAQGTVLLPVDLLLEDLDERSVAALLAGTWKASSGRVKSEVGVASPVRRAPRRTVVAEGEAQTARKPRQKRATSKRST